MLILQDILSQEIIQKLGWTLIHFIWQAAAVAFILTILLRLLRKSTANLRYIIASLALVLIVLLPVITIQLVPVSAIRSTAFQAVNTGRMPVPPPAVEMSAPETIVLEKPAQSEIVTPASSIPFKQRAIETLEPALPYIVSGWLIGVFALSIWHLGGWAQLQRLRRRMVKRVDSTLLNKLKVLTQRLRVKQTVQLMESALVQIPTVVGWLRPVILLPASALTGLTSEQLEAILAHELAHIKRYDYLINILQTVVEILGFYHPAVWWVSYKIRAERENCCDDLAVSISGDRVCYAKALTSMEEIRSRQDLAVAATGGSLFARVRRLVSKDSTEKTRFSWIPAVTAILLIAALLIPTTLALTTKSNPQKFEPKTDVPVDVKGSNYFEGRFELGRDIPVKLEAGPSGMRKIVSAKSIRFERDGPEVKPTLKANVRRGLIFEWRTKIELLNAKGKVLGARQTMKTPWGVTSGQPIVTERELEFLPFSIDEVESADRFRVSFEQVGPLQDALGREFDDSRTDWIKGRVIGPDRRPIADAIVAVAEYKPGGRVLRVPRFTTDEQGYYKFGAVNWPYKVIAEWKQPMLSGQGDCFQLLTWKQVFREPARVDFKFDELPKGSATLIGQVVDEKGSAIKEFTAKVITLHSQSPTVNWDESQGGYIRDFWLDIPVSTDDGVFQVSSLPADNYRIWIIPEPGRAYEWPRKNVVLAEGTATREIIEVLSKHVLYGRVLFQDGTPAIIKPAPWPGAKTSIIMATKGQDTSRGLAKLDEDGYFAVYLDGWDIEQLKSGKSWFDINIPASEEGHSKPMGKFPFDLLAEDKSSAGTVKIERQKTDVQVENDMSGESQQEKEAFIPTLLPTIAKSLTSSAEDKAHVQVDCLVVEVFTDLKMDRETTVVAENILEKVTTVPRGQGFISLSTTATRLLREAAEATAPKEDGSAGDKRVTQDQFKALVEMLASRGLMKILMNPRIQVVDGKTAKIKNAQGSLQESSLQITPHVSADGHIILEVKAVLGSQGISESEEQTPFSLRELYTRVRVSLGESLIIGGLKENQSAPEKQAKEVLFILTPTIIKTDNDSEKKAESSHKLKLLGLAVAMYADDHDENLPQNLQELKPYIRDEQDFAWLRDNVEYFDKGKTAQRNAAFIPIAYDKSLFLETDATNVLFLDFSVRFLDAKEVEKLDIQRAKFLIEAWLLAVNRDFIENINHNADSPDEAEELFKLKSELLAAVDGSNKLSFIPPERNVSLLLKAVRAHKDSKVLAAPQVLCQENKTAEIKVMNREYYRLNGYTEPKALSEEQKKWLDKVEEGVSISLKPKLVPNNNIEMDFKIETSQFLEVEERELKGEGQKVQRRTETLYYRVQNGQAFLFGGHKIADRQDGRTEQKDLLVLIRAQIIGSPEQDKAAMAKYPIVTEPPIIQTRTERPNVNDQEKNKPVTERRRRPARSTDDSLAKIDNKDQVVTKIFKLKNHNPSQMAQIIRPLLSETGQVSADERTGNLLMTDTVENLKRIEKIISEFDEPKAEQTVTEIFEIRYGDPVEIVGLLKKLINGRPDNGAIIEQGKEPIVLIPEPRRKWIIAKASPENMKQIGQWIEKLDIKKTIGMDPIDAAVYEQLEKIVDLSDLTPGMSFSEVIERLKNSVKPPLQIQPIWRDLLENAEVERATPSGMDPLTGIKLRKALEILLTSVSSTGLPKLTYVVDKGVILIGTVDMLPPEMVHHVYDISDLVVNVADADNLIRSITETIEPDSWYELSDKGEGTIMAYPTPKPRKLAVMQTYKILQQITRFLEDTRFSRREWEKKTPEIMIETVFLSVSKDYLKYVGLDANTENFSDGWTRLLAAKYPAGPNGQPYGLIIDDIHVRFLLRTVQAHQDSKALVAPRATVWAGETATMMVHSTKFNYISGYTEPNRPSDEPEPMHDSLFKGIELQLTPNLTPDDKHILLDVDFKLSEVLGFEERKYKGKYPYQKPIVDVISAKMPCTIPDGKIMLIGGLKINEHIKKEPGTGQMKKLFKEPGALQLKDLPLIGAAFSSNDKIKDQKMLLILVKPVINPQQKAGKILPGQADSEEQIKSLERLLEKKLNPPAKPK